MRHHSIASAACLFCLVFADTLVGAKELDQRDVVTLPAPHADQFNSFTSAIQRAEQYLLTMQSADGSWRSDVYADFRDGSALTPLVMQSLLASGADAAQGTTLRRGWEFLSQLVGRVANPTESGSDVPFPLYTATGAIISLGHSSDAAHLQARDDWLEQLLAWQLGARPGWPADHSYSGGWGFAGAATPFPGATVRLSRLSEPNMSASAHAIEALRAAGVPSRHAVLVRARRFIERLQNWDRRGGAAAGDGGFFFIQDDFVRNKAGSVVLASSRQHRSYGSATADGLTALRLTGASWNDVRLRAAMEWLQRHFRADRHPGEFDHGHQRLRDSYYYYYASSVARVMTLVAESSEPSWRVAARTWAGELAVELVARQRGDGSFVNAAVNNREDDSLVATSWATRALKACQGVLAGRRNYRPRYHRPHGERLR